MRSGKTEGGGWGINKLFTESNKVTSNRILYTPSRFSRTNLVHLQEVGELKAVDHHVSRREKLDSYLFFIVVSGEGRLEYEGETYSLKKGWCVFIDCRMPYMHSTSEKLWTLKWIHFYGPNMRSIYERYVERGGSPAFQPKNTVPYEMIWKDVYDAAASSDYLKDMVINEKLCVLQTMLMRESWHPEASRHKELKRQNLQQVKMYLDEHFAEKISLDQLAEQFYINKHYLGRIFRVQFGMTVNNYLLYVRITHAKQLLRFSDLPIEQIAENCGMEDANYFSRMFKKVEGVSPSQFRASW